MKDFFYYSMIRSKDENTTKARRLNGTVPLDELPNLMRAMGYYPTQQEVDNMKDEVKFSNFAETGQHVNAVDINTFIRLFVNHRPVYGIGKNNIQDAFQSLIQAAGSDARNGGLTKGKIQCYNFFLLDDLIRLLREEGECMGQQELEECLGLLVGDSNFKTALP
jgi:cilia- and flagella-associated protein 251